MPKRGDPVAAPVVGRALRVDDGRAVAGGAGTGAALSGVAVIGLPMTDDAVLGRSGLEMTSAPSS